MKQKAKVTEVMGNIVKVKADRSTMCEGCHAKGCGSECSMYKIFGANKSFEAKAENLAGAKVGDTVTVEIRDSAVNISAFFVFILPLIIGFAAYAVAKMFLSEQMSIVSAFGAFALYFGVLALTERIRKKAVPKLKVTSVIGDAEIDNNIKE